MNINNLRSLKTMNVLVVDDEPEVFDGLKKIMEESLISYDINFLYATNGITALDIFTNGTDSIDLVITDWQMPKMNGIDLIKCIKKRNVASSQKFVIMTGKKLTPQNKSEAFDLAIIEFIVKPFVKEEVASRIQNAFERILELKYRENQVHKQRLMNIKICEEYTITYDKLTQLSKFLRQNSTISKTNRDVDVLRKSVASTLGKLQGKLERVEEAYNVLSQTIDQMYPGFIQRLSEQEKKGNALTDANVRFCIKVALGFTNKELASIEGVEEKSIETRKSRIKKTLNLSKGRKLRHFLLGI